MKTTRLLTTACLGLLSLSPLGAQSLYWNQPAGGSLNDPANWNPQAVPDSGNTLYFEGSEDYTVTASDSLTIGYLQARGASGTLTFDFTGHTLSIGASGTSPFVINQNALLTGGTVNGTVQIGVATGSAHFILDGADTVMNGSGGQVGRTDGSNAASSNQWTIRNGASYASTSGNAIIIGSNLSAVAANHNSLLVTGTGSTLNSTGGVIVGNLGVATSGAQARNNSFTVTDGAAATLGSLVLGRRATGSLTTANGNTVQVGGSGAASSVVVTGAISVGVAGNDNVITVGSGGTLEAKGGDTTLQARSGTALQVHGGIFDATGRTLTANNNSRLNLTQNGRLIAGSILLAGTAQFGNANVGNTAFSSGTLLVGSLDASSATYTFAIGSNLGSDLAVYEMTGNGHHTFQNGVLLTQNGQLRGTGTIQTGNGSLTHQGTLGSTSLVSRITLEGNLLSASTATYEFFLGDASTYGQVATNGAIQFDGTLRVALADTFQPTAQASFNLFDFATASGTFTHLELAPLQNGLTWDLSDLYTTGVITVIPEQQTYTLLFVGTLAMAIAVRKLR